MDSSLSNSRLKHCNLKLEVDAGTVTSAELDAVYKALEDQLSHFDEMIAGLPDYADHGAAKTTSAETSFGLPLSDGPICFRLLATVDRQVNATNVGLELFFIVHKMREHSAVKELVD